jgi:DNA modification methylase
MTTKRKKKGTTLRSEQLFGDEQGHLFEKSYEEQVREEKNRPVECLGMTFPNDEKRREYFLAKLREQLKVPEFRKIEGFPIGEDEDILALSDPPYYTACPNPWIGDFIKYYGKPYDSSTDNYRREPFAVDVSEGKTDPIYKAHSYHTKVPHLAIVPSILHYTEPGDVVLDGFCGSGMTGVAAQWCGSAPEAYRRKVEAEIAKRGASKPTWGTRLAVLNDLSPAATFIAANYNRPFDVREFARAGRQILNEVEQEIGWMYETQHSDGETKCRIEYTVWSEIFTCPDCAGEVVFLDEALDKTTKRVRDAFPCPHCGSELTKSRMERCFETRLDPHLKKTIRSPKRKPSLISYKIAKQRYEKAPDEHDLKVIERIQALPFPHGLPTDRMMHAPDGEDCWGDKWRAGTASFSHVHHLFLPRAAHALAALWDKANAHPDRHIRHILLFFTEQAIRGMSILNRYKPIQFGRIGGSQVGLDMPGVYYVSSLSTEVSPWYQCEGKLSRLTKAFQDNIAHTGSAVLTTGTTARLGLSNNCIDYIFTDPPFGDNLAYAELNFVVEAFHKCFTNMKPEAIVSSHQKKGLSEYQHLMRLCFTEYCRVLKPGRWMTVVFHNSRNSVWTAIQESLQFAGFVVADVRVLDKKQGSFNQAVAVGSVKQDLVISAYKPNGGLEDRFKLEAGTEEGVWDFVRTHLKQLPVFVSKDGQAEVVAERQNYLLFDRMVAFHVQRSVTIPLSAAEFYAGLEQLFPSRDSMYFLPEQATEYDKKRMTVKQILQLQLFVSDEASAIQWLKQQLTKKPQTFQDIHPQFLKELGGWQKHEKALELSVLLEQNFLRYGGQGEVPSQIHSYLSTNWKELRNLPKGDSTLRAKGKDRWYVPDPNKAGDLEKLRDRALLREFWEYLPPDYKPAAPQSNESFLPGLSPGGAPVPKGKKIRVIRMEAVRAGFKHCYQNTDYRTIIAVAQRIPEKILQEDPKLLMWYDQAVTRSGEE